jgi:hypothetical protein
MVNPQAEVFILEYYFPSKLFVAVRQAFSNACADNEVSNVTNTPTGKRI